MSQITSRANEFYNRHTVLAGRDAETLGMWNDAVSVIREVERELAAMSGRAGRAEEILGILEFSGYQRKCPLCAGWNMSPNGETPKVHMKSCELGRILNASRPHSEPIP